MSKLKSYTTKFKKHGDTKFFICGMEGFETLGRKRTYGWYSKFSDASKAVLTNAGYIEDCGNDYMVIEEIPEGVWSLTVKEWWFKWNRKKQKYFSINKPKDTYGIINWSV